MREIATFTTHNLHYITSKAREGVLPFFHLKAENLSLLNPDRKKTVMA